MFKKSVSSSNVIIQTHKTYTSHKHTQHRHTWAIAITYTYTHTSTITVKKELTLQSRHLNLHLERRIHTVCTLTHTHTLVPACTHRGGANVGAGGDAPQPISNSTVFILLTDAPFYWPIALTPPPLQIRGTALVHTQLFLTDIHRRWCKVWSDSYWPRYQFGINTYLITFISFFAQTNIH